MSTVIRGIANKNSFNIKQTIPDPWLGSTGKDDLGHAIFIDQVYSIRAACRILAQYQNIHDLRTLNAIFARWAPADDPNAKNEPSKYAKFVSDRTGFAANMPVDLFMPDGEIAQLVLFLEILKAMLEMECYAGFKLPIETLQAGCALYEHDFLK